MSDDSNNAGHDKRDHEGDVAFIQALAKLLNRNELTELTVKREYDENDRLTVSLTKQGKQVVYAQGPAAPSAPAPQASAPAPVAAAAPVRGSNGCPSWIARVAKPLGASSFADAVESVTSILFREVVQEVAASEGAERLGVLEHEHRVVLRERCHERVERVATADLRQSLPQVLRDRIGG